MAVPVTVVVTRPGAAGQALADALVQAGQPALWLPAFDFAAAPDQNAARATLNTLADFDLAIFVSPQAARATAALLDGRWPAGTAIAAVGAGTRAAVLAIDGAAAATLIAPAAEDMRGGGSESLWPLLQRLARLRRVLLLRAQSGREWLGEQLQQAGATVVSLAVYSRRVHAPTAEARSGLATAAAKALASVITSSDAVAALATMLQPQPEVLRALRAGPALAAHPRIAAALREAGYEHVIVCAAQVEPILTTLRAGQPLESAARRANKSPRA